MRDCRILDKYNWNCYNKDDIFVVFSDGDTDIGVVECNIDSDGVAFIEMIEVFEPMRRKGYGERIIKQLQQMHGAWSCVPIDTSDRFFRHLGFSPITPTSHIWYWPQT